MPVSPTYPGVYIQEVDSGSRVVSGVATSITAFIGRTLQGPANTATTVFTYGEFEKLFGGRTRDLPMTYSVEDFFNNGGSQAVIVRVCSGPPLGTAASVKLPGINPAVTITSALKGTIANSMTLNATPSKNYNAASPAFDIALKLGPQATLATLSAITPDTFYMSLNSLSDFISISGNLSADQAKQLLGIAAPAAPQAQGGQQGQTPEQPAQTPEQPAQTPEQQGQTPEQGQAPQQQAQTPQQQTQAPAKPQPVTWQFAGAQDANPPSATTFTAGTLAVTVGTGGPWTDDLSVSIVPQGTTKFVFAADHPLFATPLNVAFTDWASLGTGLTATGLFTLQTPPTPAVGAYVNGGISLTRMPDATGSSASMLTFGPLVLMANSPGAWGNQIAVYFDKKRIDVTTAARYSDYGINDATDFWNINVVYPYKKGQTQLPVAEVIGPVYLGPIDAPCRVDHVLATESQYLSARQPVVAPAASDLLLDPSKVGAATDADPNAQQGVLIKGQDGKTLSSDIVLGSASARTGLYALDAVDLFNILVIPPDQLLSGDPEMCLIYGTAAAYCTARRAILIADPLDQWGFSAKKSQFDAIMPTDFGINEITTKRSVFTYFPRVKKLDPEHGNQERVFSASGMIAGIFATTDVRRGVWKAPAGIEAGMNGVTNLEYKLSDMQNGVLNQVGVNVLRDFPVIGKVVWGSRTLAGADALSDDYKYLPVRRLTNYIEESLFRGTKFAVFEPNAETLWAQLRLTVGSFMSDLARQGAFYDYYVQCDKTTTTQYDIDRGRVNVIVAFAPVKPAEFVILTIQQLAGQTAA